MILYNELTGNRLTDAGAIDRTSLKISYDVYASWPVKFVEEDGVTAVDVSDATAWKASIDDDFDHASEVMARTLDADIDSSQAADGIITPVLDTYTAQYLAAVGTNEKITAYFELRGFNAEGRVVHECRFPILAYNTIDPEGESELDPPSDDASKTWAEATFVKRDFSGFDTKEELVLADTFVGNDSENSGNVIVVTFTKVWNLIKSVLFPGSMTVGSLIKYGAGGILEDAGVETSTDGTLADDSDAKIPTEKAVKTYVDASASATPPGGSSTYVQYNDGGELAGDSNFTWNKTNKVLTVAGILGMMNGMIATIADDSITDQEQLAINVSDCFTADIIQINNFSTSEKVFSVSLTGIEGTHILDEDDMNSDSDVKLATQQSIKAYADTKEPLLGFTPADSAITVNGYALTGNVTLTADDLADGSTNAAITLTQETNFETAYSHSQATSGNPHSVGKSDVGLGNVANILDKLDATAAPTADEDSGDGYGVGSLWVDVTHDKSYICLDATSAAAVWREIAPPSIVKNSATLSNGTVSLDAYKDVYAISVSSATTFTFSTSNLPSLTNKVVTFELHINMTVVSTLTFPASVSWLDTPVFSSTGTYVLVFRTSDGGTNWLGNLAYEA